MSDEQEEGLSDDELNSLLSDLESRSSGGGGASADIDAPGPEDEDLESFLAQAEQEDDSTNAKPSKPKVADRNDEQAGPDLSDLEGADELPVKGGEGAAAAKKSKSDESSGVPAEQKKNESEGKSSGTSGASPWQYVALVAKWLGYGLPVLALWWIVGAYLGQWVSAGWLIFLVATTFVIGVPIAAYRLAKGRGRLRWWMAGVSLALTVGLVAPLSGPAAKSLTNFGHWPATAFEEVTGVGDGFLIEANGAIGEWLGRQLDPTLSADEAPRALGTTATPTAADTPTGGGGD